jgi:hypothetical protein
MSKRFNLGFALFLFTSDLALVVAALLLATQARIVLPFGKEASTLHWRLPLQPMCLHAEDDLFYIRHYSLWLDVKILWRTIWVAVSGQGAY